MWWRELDEVENERTSYNSSLFVIFLPNIIKIGINLTKFWQKQICTIFLRRGVQYPFWGPQPVKTDLSTETALLT